MLRVEQTAHALGLMRFVLTQNGTESKLAGWTEQEGSRLAEFFIRVSEPNSGAEYFNLSTIQDDRV